MSIDRFLPRARRLPLLIPPLSPADSALFVTPFVSLFVPLSRPFSTSLRPSLPPPSCPYLHPTFSCPLSFRRTSSFSPFCFLFLFLSVSLFLSRSLCDRTTQPNNRHRRLKPENSAASSLLFSCSTRPSSFAIPLQCVVSSFTTKEFCYRLLAQSLATPIQIHLIYKLYSYIKDVLFFPYIDLL